MRLICAVLANQIFFSPNTERNDKMELQGLSRGNLVNPRNGEYDFPTSWES